MPQGLKRFLKKNNPKDFFTKIQKSDECVKKRYLLIFSVIAMIIVIGLWILYLEGAYLKGGLWVKVLAEKISSVFIAIGHGIKNLFFLIKKGRVIIIER